MTVKRPVTLGGKYSFEPGDIMSIQFEGLAQDPNQWQRPTEFLPQRFDNSDPLSLTPSGKKRHVNSWVPFHGGSRVCFGKTLAEAQIKVLHSYLTQKFNLEFEEEKYKTEMPFA